MSNNIPELEVLSKFVGSWDVAATADGKPAAQGHQETKWTLGGRFVQTTGVVTIEDADDIEILSLTTFDTAKKKFRWWTFMSNGHSEESDGTWDANTNTMMRITNYGEITQTATSDFNEPDVENWTIINMDRNNNVVSEMSGANTRRNK